jgi:hypothetical protein
MLSSSRSHQLKVQQVVTNRVPNTNAPTAEFRLLSERSRFCDRAGVIGDGSGLYPSALPLGLCHRNRRLAESTVNFKRSNYAFTRLELVDKDELFPQAATHPAYRIGAYTFGGVRDLVQTRAWQLGLGADVTFYSKPGVLDASYGNNPVSFQIFLRVRPSLTEHRH